MCSLFSYSRFFCCQSLIAFTIFAFSYPFLFPYIHNTQYAKEIRETFAQRVIRRRMARSKPCGSTYTGHYDHWLLRQFALPRMAQGGRVPHLGLSAKPQQRRKHAPLLLRQSEASRPPVRTCWSGAEQLQHSWL